MNIKKIGLLAASDMNAFSKAVEAVLPDFEKNIQVLNKSLSAYASLAKPESSHDVEQALNSRNSLSQMLNLVRIAKENMKRYRETVLLMVKQNLKELNKAASRQSQALNGIISNLEQLESFALRAILLIDEKFDGPPTSKDKAE